MPAAQFGNHPTLSQYLVWAREQGCKVDHGAFGTLGVIKITAPGGDRWVHVTGLQHDEYLLPRAVAAFDRRLGLRSPFSKLDG